jgi:TRAP-type C4-dicarboxylate transport system substrate-binding protein
VRDEMVQIVARDAKAANVELEVQVYPGASLFKPNEQWNALVNGQLDISSFPARLRERQAARRSARRSCQGWSAATSGRSA